MMLRQLLLSFVSVGLSIAFLVSCQGSSTGSGDGAAATPTPTPTAVRCSDIEAQMTALLDSTETPDNLPYTYLIERLSDHRQYSYSKSGSSSTTSYESASTSKWISGLIIMRAIESAALGITEKPQDRIGSWPITNSSSLYNLTLAQLLSFSSGLTSEPGCVNLEASNFATCVNQIGSTNAANSVTPGSEFYYASTHLQVAGQMVIAAKSMANWQAVFDEFKTQTSLFPSSAYDLPSSTNPRLAGGMHWTASEYLSFLRKLAGGDLLGTSAMSTYLQDRTNGLTITYSPVSSVMSEEWHYGMGYWHECQNSTWNCQAAARISSPGAYGSYPFWDRTNGYIGILARQGSLGTYPYGIQVERAVRSLTLQWLTCQ